MKWPSDLLRQVRRACLETGENRSEFVRRAVKDRLLKVRRGDQEGDWRDIILKNSGYADESMREDFQRRRATARERAEKLWGDPSSSTATS